MFTPKSSGILGSFSHIHRRKWSIWCRASTVDDLLMFFSPRGKNTPWSMVIEIWAKYVPDMKEHITNMFIKRSNDKQTTRVWLSIVYRQARPRVLGPTGPPSRSSQGSPAPVSESKKSSQECGQEAQRTSFNSNQLNKARNMPGHPQIFKENTHE